MATFEITIDDEKIHELLQGDRGMAALLEPILNQILQAEMTDHLGAEPGECTDRQGYRNGSYRRKLTTRVGRLELEVPRDRDGTFQTELFQRYQRSEKALVLALMQMVVQGVSTRRVKEITTELCGREFSKSTVSRLTGELDEQVEAWSSRSLEEQSYPFLVMDAMHLKVRRQGAVRSTTVMLAVGINEAGQREILGLETAFGETAEGWRRFIRGLKRRGLSGVEVATSDAHDGLVQAEKKSTDNTSGGQNAEQSINLSAPVSRKEAKKRRKATSPEKSSSPSARGRGTFLNEDHNGESASEQA